MKKTSFYVTLIVLCLITAAGLCYIRTNGQRNTDLLPSSADMITLLKSEGEGAAFESIKGLHLDSLTAQWGQPDGKLFGLFGLIWESDEDFYVVYFDSAKQAVQVKLGEWTDVP